MILTHGCILETPGEILKCPDALVHHEPIESESHRGEDSDI